MLSSDKNMCIEGFCQEHPLLLEHLDAVLKQNKSLNLTRITEKEAGKVLHIEDSLAVLPELEQAPEGALADLGSGAGFPGIPLALVTGRTTSLIEASKKKAQFLEDFLMSHGLTHITVEAKRSEELAQESPGRYAVVTARAVAELPALVELAAPLLEPGGVFIALKGNPTLDEIERGKAVAELVGMTATGARDYTLSLDDAQRSVYTYSKTGESTRKLPRRPGMATKRPLA